MFLKADGCLDLAPSLASHKPGPLAMISFSKKGWPQLISNQVSLDSLKFWQNAMILPAYYWWGSTIFINSLSQYH